MAIKKTKTTFFCQNCGTQSAKWSGRCHVCGEWNTIAEEVISTNENPSQTWKQAFSPASQRVPKAMPLHAIETEGERRIESGDKELDRTLGGGIVPGSLVLIGGEPGIGKSTLMLQIALQLKKMKTLYVSGEESVAQIKMRAERINIQPENCYILAETSTQNIFQQIEEIKPNLVVVDSIQTLFSSFIDSTAGSVSQVRQCTAELIRFAKETDTPVFLIGHITKDGMLAGPKMLEHMVDTVLQFEGDRHHVYRILRTTKNRFGSTSELGIYEMGDRGLREVSNPSEILITQREHDLSGVAIGASLEGNRPLLIEIQSLVTPSNYGTPQRTSTGFDSRRLSMLLAVLEKRSGFRLGAQDVFLNIAGGLKVEDPALDLAICVSLVSSFQDIPVEDKCCFAGEIGLGGEIRAINRIENRIAEAEKLGFRKIYISKYQKTIASKYKISVKSVGKLDDIFSDLFG
jgi:DNA repair protein RadA/Sms